MDTLLNAFVFGGCLTRMPVKASPLAKKRLRIGRYALRGAIHNFGEMIQLIEVLRQTRDISPELRRIGRMPEPDNRFKQAFTELDVAIVEPASEVEITFRDMSLNRNLLKDYILGLTGPNRESAASIFDSWLRIGVTGRDEKARRELSEQLIPLISRGSEQEELAHAILREAHGIRRDMVSGFRKMQELLRCPIGAVIYTFRYMPDGRPVSWPGKLRTDVLNAARELDIPVFDPVDIVRNYGVSRALAGDLGHYHEAFSPIIGDVLVEFMESVHAGQRFTAPAGMDDSLRSFKKQPA